ncbi:MAG TPA: nicotinate-nucleotide--dimethylbenzimidazole phosphoribosyltransferase [Kofleriaceae bacterium]|jgi:nicotinate-nucleotide--dimethylbenzimidazole phosphoribosyltransferase|nr:nicotinate-nucleotide--dimethylbenzimidazole phosphoribosyltransferase [Kofleriaceae bacterium]
MSDPAVLRHVIGAITPASIAHGEAARRRVAAAGAPVLERLAAALGAAQHTPRPRTTRRAVVVCAGDHGVGDPGVALGAAHPTAIAAHAIADGTAALAALARASRAPVVLVDAGSREPSELPASAVRLGRGPSADLMAGPAMTVMDAALALEAGIALAVSLADGDGVDLIAVGALGIGADVASAALLGAATGAPPAGLGDPLAEAAGALGAAMAGASGLELLAAFGGPETGVLAGLMLAAASTNTPVILDGYATGAAALIAAALAPSAAGYLVAAHTGAFTQPRILAHLGLHPMFDLGLGHGEGTGAAMAFALIDHMAAVASQG